MRWNLTEADEGDANAALGEAGHQLARISPDSTDGVGGD
jgi:hypothetical protein